MRVLWAPWRVSYIEQHSRSEQPGCIFCLHPAKATRQERRDALVLHAGGEATVMMNRYPYAQAHLMIAPRLHTADFAALDARIAAAVQSKVQLAVSVLERSYRPGGFNIGVNLGRVAGAGIADHLHWHVVPRWQGDTNFMPMLGETRVISQHLYETFDRLLPLFEEAVS